MLEFTKYNNSISWFIKPMLALCKLQVTEDIMDMNDGSIKICRLFYKNLLDVRYIIKIEYHTKRG